jgi:hypothetical protein
MPMAKDKHEEILGKLLNPELAHSERTELLQQLRVDYGVVHADHTEQSTKLEKLTADNSDLVLSNSKLFRQIGRDSNEDKIEDTKKEFSETVTIEQFERGLDN